MVPYKDSALWYLYKMVTQNMLRTYVVNLSFSREKIGFEDSIDVTKCLQQIEIRNLLHMCAPCSKLPSNISTMCRYLSNKEADYQIISILLIEKNCCGNKKCTANPCLLK